jgi:6 kDa early secretory antigenic target
MAASEDSIFVNYSGTETILENLGSADYSIHQVLGGLAEAIAPLRATWSGASETEYSAIQRKWNHDIDQMDHVLVKAGKILGEMTNNYSTTDNRVADGWAGIA